VPFSRMALYPYQKLKNDEIRVLYLTPGRTSDPILCGLITLSLSSNPRYEALSYAWGTIDSLDHITVDGSPMRIRANLETALRHLRRENEGRFLWVDAICINQEDDEERTHQVSHMGVIYSKATSTVIYLGDLNEDANRAMDALELFAQDKHFPELPIWRDDDPKRIEWTGIIIIEYLLYLPWWRRIWVIQEVALSRNLSGSHLKRDGSSLTG
jgi:hypothetical protein